MGIYSMGSDRKSLAFAANVYGQIRDHGAGFPSPESLLIGDSVDQFIDRQACSILNSGVFPGTYLPGSTCYATDLTAVRKVWS
jgi:hypothetical protein